MSHLVSPCHLSHQTLSEIVSRIQRRLYLDSDEHGTEFWNPTKDWSCADVCQDVQELLHRHGLVPGEEHARDETAPASENRSIESLVAWVESRGVESDDLDELVHDCCSTTASDINNRGLAEQIRFLVDQLGESDAAAQVTEIGNSHEQDEQSAVELDGEDATDHVTEIVDSPAGERGSQFGTETHCLRSPTGEHVPDEDTIHLEPDGGDWYVDVNCVHCGRSGCIAKFDAEDVDW